jgi:2-polyprenyl-6-methoxyphenol hydroxylase-like FAD-dependent oxidoreductase
MKVLIIGGGIGGLATALSLHAVGIECEVYEKSSSIRELGVGVNMLPHAVKELAGLGLFDELDRLAIRTYELIYANRFGQRLWRELRGLHAGYDFPQFSVHRGKLQGLLYAAARERIGDGRIHTDRQLCDVAQSEEGVAATFVGRDGEAKGVAQGDALIAADGIHSTVRRKFYPQEGPPAWNGIMMWRGALEYPPFLTGRSMIVAGGMDSKLVVYPISNRTSRPGTNLLNWVVVTKLADASQPPPRREDWSRPGRLDEVLPRVRRVFRISMIDPVDIVRATPAIYEYPMCDRDPVREWSFGRVTLLGDAAHPMYPVGSNGASQAILDARCVARFLAETGDAAAAFKAYEAARLPATARIVRDNRSGGPERIIDIVEQRAPDGFERLDGVASHAELESIVKGYARAAGFDQAQVNR